MAHELQTETSTGRVRMFFVEGSNNRPWHAKETNPIKYTSTPTLDQVSKDLATHIEVKMRSVYDEDGGIIDEVREIYRPNLDTNLQPILVESPNGSKNTRQQSVNRFGLVSPNYEIIQDQQLVDFFKPWIEANVVTLETGGAIFDGAGFWILAKINYPAQEVMKHDIVQNYLLISNFHNGKKACTVRQTNIRVVCNNTLDAACRKSKAWFTVRHQGDIQMKIEQIQKVLTGWQKSFSDDIDFYKALASFELKNEKQLEHFFSLVLKKDKKEDDEKEEIEDVTQKQEKERKNFIIETVRKEYDKDYRKMQNGHSLWGGVNAFTALTTHATNRNLSSRISSMYQSTNFTSTATQIASQILEGKIKIPDFVSVQVPRHANI